MSLCPAIEVKGVSKSYGGVHALRGVDFTLRPGEVHGLIGANGAGKSTLCKIIAGIEAPTSGAVVLNGVPVEFRSVREAAALGIDMIHQELSLFPNLSVAENLFVGRELCDDLGLVDRAAQVREASAVLHRLGFGIDPNTALSELSVGLQQIVEIAKALVHKARILLMDEPTSALSRVEVERLFGVIGGLAADGVSIVYISHRLDEMIEVCDRVTVMRDGEIVEKADCKDVDPPWIVERMTGRSDGAEVRTSQTIAGASVLEVRKLCLPRRSGRVGLSDVSFGLRTGEVVGVFGLLGAGRSELFEALLGVHDDASGYMALEGVGLSGCDIAERVALGFALVPEDRQRDGLVDTMSVQQNMTLSALRGLTTWSGLRADLERIAAETMVTSLRIKLPALDGPVQALSGGNQQKVVLARSLLAKPKVLLLDEPTRGVDVAAKVEILSRMHELAQAGMAVMFASSDASEILAASTRILIMSRGRIAREMTPHEASERALMEAASVKAEEGEVAA